MCVTVLSALVLAWSLNSVWLSGRRHRPNFSEKIGIVEQNEAKSIRTIKILFDSVFTDSIMLWIFAKREEEKSSCMIC